jgi:hypothetical protein
VVLHLAHECLAGQDPLCDRWLALLFKIILHRVNPEQHVGRARRGDTNIISAFLFFVIGTRRAEFQMLLLPKHVAQRMVHIDFDVRR